jgi:hypothetical protein
MSILSRTAKKILVEYHLAAKGVYSRLRNYPAGAAHYLAAADLLSDLVIEELSRGADAAIKTGHSFKKDVYAKSLLLGPVRYEFLGKHLDSKLDRLREKYAAEGVWITSHGNEHFFDGGRLIPLYGHWSPLAPHTPDPCSTMSARFVPLKLPIYG